MIASDTWWTFGFESFGPFETVENSLRATAKELIGDIGRIDVELFADSATNSMALAVRQELEALRRPTTWPKK